MNPDEQYCECCNLKKGKQCNKCLKNKTISEFDTGRKTCKGCRKNYNAKQYQIKKDKQSVEKLNLKP